MSQGYPEEPGLKKKPKLKYNFNLKLYLFLALTQRDACMFSM